MRELAGKPMLVRTRRKVEPLQQPAQDPAVATTRVSAGTTASNIRTSTTAICGGCSRIPPSTPAT